MAIDAALSGLAADDAHAGTDRVAPGLSPQQRDRYARHLLLPEVGDAGQRRLLNSSALVVGAGGLGSPVALYLTAAGVGRIGLVDFDVVEASNLQRQVLHGTDRLGVPKVVSGRETLAALNPDVQVDAHKLRIDTSNAAALVEAHDVVVVCCDNFATRYLVNDACLAAGRPSVHGAIFKFEGNVTSFVPGRGPCYRCLHGEPPPESMVPKASEVGVLGVVPGLVGMLQAAEALKLILDIGDPLVGRVLAVDVLDPTFRILTLRQDPQCLSCGFGPAVPKQVQPPECS
jgi:molybdopterin/thiamine biosynthesis adenylyltransferase